MDIIYLFKLLYKKRWVLMSVLLIGIVAAFLLTMNMSKTFVSTAKLATGFNVPQKVGIDEEKFNLYESNAKFNNLMESITSESVLALLAYNLMLHDLTGSEPPFTDPYNNKNNKTAIRLTDEEKEIAISVFKANLEKLKVLSTYDEFEKKLTELIELHGYDQAHLLKNLSVKRINLSDYVIIQYGSHNPRLSAFVVNTLAQEFLRYDATIYNNQTGQSVDILTRQIEESKRRLDEKTHALEEYKTANNLVDFDTETESKITKLSEYDERFKEETNNLRKLQISLSDVRQRIKDSGIDRKTESRNKRIFSLREEVDNLNDQYINAGSKDIGLKSRIDTKKDELKELLVQQQATTTSTDTDELLNKQQALILDIKISESNLVSIKKSIFEMKKGFSGFAQHESALIQLQKELTLASEGYLAAVDKLNKAKTTANTTENSIQIIQFGMPEGEPEDSKRALIVLISGVVCLLVYCLGLITVIYLDHSIRSPSRLKEQIDLPLITALPGLNKRQLQIAYSENIEPIANKKLNTFFFHLNEIFKNIRFELFQSNGRTVLITSNYDQEGKSFVTINLAKSLGLTSKKTLIVDANFGNNFITNFFKADSEGLKKAIQTPLQLTDFVSPTTNPLISILGCSAEAVSPIEMMTESQLATLLSTARQTFDYVLIEGSSLNNSSGSRELEKNVDILLPILSASSVLKESDKIALAFLNSKKHKVLGVVLNKVQKENINI